MNTQKYVVNLVALCLGPLLSNAVFALDPHPDNWYGQLAEGSSREEGGMRGGGVFT